MGLPRSSQRPQHKSLRAKRSKPTKKSTAVEQQNGIATFLAKTPTPVIASKANPLIKARKLSNKMGLPHSSQRPQHKSLRAKRSKPTKMSTPVEPQNGIATFLAKTPTPVIASKAKLTH